MVTIPRAPGIAFIEAQMETSIVVTRDNRGVHNDILNEATGMLEPAPTDDPTTIYSGSAIIAMIDKGDKELAVAEMPKEFNYYKVLMPQNASSGAIRIGDILTVTASTNNSSLVGSTYRVSKDEKASHPVYRRLQVEKIDDSIGTSNPAVF